MSFAPWIVNFRSLQRNLHIIFKSGHFQIVFFVRFLPFVKVLCINPLRKAINERKTRFENDQIWKLCKFRCNGRKFTIHGAKDIYSIQRFQWMNFRIEISTIYPQMKTFVPHVNFTKIAKKSKFQKLYMLWILTGMSSYA